MGITAVRFPGVDMDIGQPGVQPGRHTEKRKDVTKETFVTGPKKKKV